MDMNLIQSMFVGNIKTISGSETSNLIKHLKSIGHEEVYANFLKQNALNEGSKSCGARKRIRLDDTHPAASNLLNSGFMGKLFGFTFRIY